jgi:hypothetical protein
MGEMRRAIAREQDERRTQDRFLSTLVIAAAIIAAVRLAREDISTPSPRLLSTIGDSVSLAKMILKRVVGGVICLRRRELKPVSSSWFSRWLPYPIRRLNKSAMLRSLQVPLPITKRCLQSSQVVILGFLPLREK